MNFTRSSVLILITISATMFVFTMLASGDLETVFALYFPENEKFGVWQLVTHLFLHGSLMHLLFNMYALWMFGTSLEKIWGIKRFLIFYFISGIGAALVYTFVNYYQFYSTYDQLIGLGAGTREIQNILSDGIVNSEWLNSVPESQLREFFLIYHTPAVGASGAIYGILIAFAFTYPDVKLALIFLPVPIKSKYFVPLLIAADLFFGLTKYSVGNIAHFAHIGGAIFGLLIMLWWRRKNKG